MEIKDLLWYGVLGSITGAYLISLWGMGAAKQHNVTRHSRLMIITCTIVGIWLVAYVTKQFLFSDISSSVPSLSDNITILQSSIWSGHTFW